MRVVSLVSLFSFYLRSSCVVLCRLGVANLSIALLVGCARAPNSPTTPSTSAVSGADSVSGNWSAVATPLIGSAPVNGFAGSFNQTNNASDFGIYITAVLHVQALCFAASPITPLQGNIKSGVLEFDSYVVNGQALHLDATVNPAGTAMQGTYSVSGGCAPGAAGSFIANRYSPLTGVYTGVLSPNLNNIAAALTLKQQVDSTGSGTFLLTGTATFTGVGCALRASAEAASINFVQGSQVSLTFNAVDGSGAAVSVVGTFDQTATTISPQVLLIKGGGCAGSFAGSVFAR